MIVEVIACVKTDDGLPVIAYERREMVVQTPDGEGNLLRAAALLDDLMEEGCKVTQRQTRQIREAHAAEGAGDGTA